VDVNSKPSQAKIPRSYLKTNKNKRIEGVAQEAMGSTHSIGSLLKKT
jgi:hypothetical protein